jgi:AcrR family transcriptional regulator
VESIYEAAVQVFTENGYTASTTDLIAERAGVSIGTLYQYFPNKKAILVGIWNRGMEDADRGRDLFVNRFKGEGGVGPTWIVSIVKGILEIHKRAVRPQLFFEEVPQPDFIKERLLEKESVNIRAFRNFLEHCGTNLRPQRLDLAARVMYEILERLIHRYLTHFYDELSEEEFVREASDVISRYLFADEKA